MADTVTAQPDWAQYAPSPEQTGMIQQPPQPAYTPQPQQQGFTPSPGDIENYGAAVHHGRLANALNAVASILGGSQTLRMKKNSDGSVDLEQVDSTPGEKWGRVAKAALSGAATGFAVGQGPGGGARAAAASIQQGLAEPGIERDKTLDLAKQMNDQNRQAQMFKANMAMLNQKLVKDAYDMQQSKLQAGEHEEDRQASIQQAMDKAGAKVSIHVGGNGDPNKMMEDIANAYNSSPELSQAHHDGRTLVFHTTDPKTGLVNGANIYIVPEDAMDKPAEPFTRKHLVLNTEHPDLAPVWKEDPDPIINMKMKDKLALLQSDETYANQLMGQWDQRRISQQQADATTKNAETTASLAPSEIALRGAETRKADAEAQDGSKGTLVQGEDAQGNPVLYNNKTGEIKTGAGIQRVGTAAKQAAAMEKDIGPARDAVNYANDYLTLKKFTGPKDEALMEKYFDLAKPSTGFRMSQPQQDMLKKSQSWYDSLRASGAHLAYGTWFSDTQRKQIVDAMNDLAKAKYKGAQTVYGVGDGSGTPEPAPAFDWNAHPKVN